MIDSENTMFRRARPLLEAELGDEIVALDPEGGSCFGFNEVAAWVWRRLDQPRSFDDLRAGLIEEYDVDADRCGRELADLLRDMADKRLIETVERR